MRRLEGTLELLETKDAAIIDQLLQDFGDLDVAALLGEAVDSVASINLEQVADHLAQCVVAREAYMKAYAEVTLLGTPLARLSMHERDGISFAHYDLVDGKKIVASHKYTWHEVLQGPSFTLCGTGDFICIEVSLGLTGVPNSIMGIELPESLSDLDLGDTKFLEIKFRKITIDMDKVGIPFPSFEAEVEEVDIIFPFMVQLRIHTCDEFSCSSHQVAKAASSSIQCTGDHSCTAAECCLGTCARYSCGDGWSVKSDAAATCLGEECQRSECCQRSEAPYVLQPDTQPCKEGERMSEQECKEFAAATGRTWNRAGSWAN